MEKEILPAPTYDAHRFFRLVRPRNSAVAQTHNLGVRCSGLFEGFGNSVSPSRTLTRTSTGQTRAHVARWGLQISLCGAEQISA